MSFSNYETILCETSIIKLLVNVNLKFTLLQEGPRHTQSATSVIINPVAVEDFRSRVQGVASERMQGRVAMINI